MPALETMDLYDRALVWPFVRTDGDGAPVVATDAKALDVRVRWVSKKYEMVGPKTATEALDAQVVVALNVKVGSLIWRVPNTDPAVSALEQFYGTGTGTGTSDDQTPLDHEIMQVKSVDKAEDLKGRWQRRTLNCMRFGNALPKQE